MKRCVARRLQRCDSASAPNASFWLIKSRPYRMTVYDKLMTMTTNVDMDDGTILAQIRLRVRSDMGIWFSNREEGTVSAVSRLVDGPAIKKVAN
jgi:hypothetical protein